MTSTRSDPPPAPDDPRLHGERGPNLALVLAGLGLLALGVLWLLDTLGLVDLRWSVVLPAALVAVGVALLVTARRGGHGGLIGVGVVLSVIVVLQVLTAAAFPFGGIGETVTLTATVGIGELVVRLPDDVVAEVSARGGLGEVTVLDGTGPDHERSGVGPRGTWIVGDGEPTLRLELRVGIGSTEVRR